MKKMKPAFVCMATIALVLAAFTGPAFSANLSLQATTDGSTEASQFMRGDSIILNILMDNSTPPYLAGCAFTVTYDDTLLDPPATNADGTPVDDSVTSVFPFTFQTEQMHRENSSESGKVYLAGATINEENGGAKTGGQADAVLFTLVFKVKDDATIGSTFSFGLEQTQLMNPDAGYGTDVDGDGVYDPGDGDQKAPVTVLVGAVAQGEPGYDNFDCSGEDPCAFPEIANNLPVTGDQLEVVPSPPVSGTVAYTGSQTGLIIVGVFNSSTPSSDSLVAGVSIAAPGAFTIPNVTKGSGYYLFAFRDSDGGSDLGTPVLDIDPAEAQGILTTPFDVLEAVSGKSVTLTDPDNNADGIPDYWYPGIGAAGNDFDQDGYSNLVEFQNQTDPTADDPPFGTGYDAATDERGPYQKISLSPAERGAQPGGSFALTVNYDVTDNSSLLSGIDISVHFDSTKITYVDYDNDEFLENGDIVSPPTLLDDTQDEDGDPATDKRINMSWSSFTGQWPNTTLPAVLAKLNFTLSDTMTDGETHINVSVFDLDPNYSFYGTGAKVFAQDWTVDIDANTEAKPLTDGLLAVRYLFRYHLAGSSWIEGFVAANAGRSTAAEIEAYLADAVTSLALDIDGNGECKPLTDGLLLVRYLFRYHLAGPSWIDGFVASNATRTTAEQIEAYLQSIMP